MKLSFLSVAYFSLTVSSISMNFFDKLFVFSKTRALSPGKPWLEISFKRFCKTSRSFLRSSNSDVDSYKTSTWDVGADTENRPVAVKGEGMGRGGVGVWDQWRQTLRCRRTTGSYCTAGRTALSIWWQTTMEKNMEKNIRICIYTQTPFFNNMRDDFAHEHHQMANTEIKSITFLTAKDGEAVNS